MPLSHDITLGLWLNHSLARCIRRPRPCDEYRRVNGQSKLSLSSYRRLQCLKDVYPFFDSYSPKPPTNCTYHVLFPHTYDSRLRGKHAAIKFAATPLSLAVHINPFVCTSPIACHNLAITATYQCWHKAHFWHASKCVLLYIGVICFSNHIDVFCAYAFLFFIDLLNSPSVVFAKSALLLSQLGAFFLLARSCAAVITPFIKWL